jgi:rhombotail lipoprotein
MPAMKPSLRPLLLAATAVAATAFLAGCASAWSSRGKTDRSSSVVAFLYPGESNPLPPTDIPVLRLPLRVGIAFVPTAGARGGWTPPGGISETQKAALMERVAREFRGRDFIGSIELIPTTYLRPGGGFANLDQLAGLMGVEVVALLAYDQAQFTDDNFLSLAYWTIVGAYVVKGNKNDTHTLMEAAVYDIRSRHLLFRAPGVNQLSESSTLVGLSERRREASAKGFDLATDELVRNLQVQLDGFRERVKRAPGEVKIEHRPGYTGAGAGGPAFAGAVLLLALAGGWLARRARG